MAALPGLNLRGGIYQLRTTIPIALRTRFGRDRIRKSLGTSDRPEAELLATIERARLLALFAAAKKTSGDVTTISEQTRKVLEPLQGILIPAEANTGVTGSTYTSANASPLPLPLQPPRKRLPWALKQAQPCSQRCPRSVSCTSAG
ncbi:DUF6538 domain-containing protein [Comamonas sp. 4034]|uniref:DUF6538 domain-containing protein n=1 Tax=Comamonas sp. 4034 TaxID=3156455 RepID=UPI003D2564E5